MTHAITTKYLPATNTRGARIKVTSRFGIKYYSYDYAAKCAHKAAFFEWMFANDGHKLEASALLPDGSGHVFIVTEVND